MRRLPGEPAGRRVQALAALALLGLAILLQTRIDARAAVRSGTHPILYLPSGRYLKVVALGFDDLLADMIFLWSIQYYGNYDIQDRYDYLDQIYTRVITDLDPHYLDPYLVGALIMNVEARRPVMALRLLDKGIAHNPDKWILAFEAGFLCYNDLKDYRRAAVYFEKALQAPDVHPLVRRLYAEMYNRAGDPRTSLQQWLEIYDSSRDDYVRHVAWNHAHDLKVRIDLDDLTAAVTRYRDLHGRPPRRPGDLVAAGLLPRLPRDPEGRDYRYDPGDGTVAYRGGLVLAR
jgi:tetratricopeptide (TPR) repeat protein